MGCRRNYKRLKKWIEIENFTRKSALSVKHDFIIAIVEHIETLSSHPDIGRMVPEFSDEQIRELIHSPFRVVCLRESKSIKVIRVWRSERLLGLPDHSA
ncbi:MAG: type II toxin-antitoxin system RelE/ParE family toxin [Gammaproteobacteria bacterium]|nr:type II toxin-antitoxin system RelE/ParE family toxin [Gammaproteobacteria bacterium]